MRCCCLFHHPYSAAQLAGTLCWPVYDPPLVTGVCLSPAMYALFLMAQRAQHSRRSSYLLAVYKTIRTRIVPGVQQYVAELEKCK